MRGLLLGILLAGPALGQEGLDGDKFEALVEGRSLGWAHAGEEPYGLERYFPGRRVLWLRTETRECQEGKWWEQEGWTGPEICFDYEDDPLVHCWRVGRKDERLSATSAWGGGTIFTELGPEHETPFGCGYLGL